jgi:hypothetical protein
MAWTGSATVKKVSDNLTRVTGLSLAASASGTIGLSGGTGDVDIVDQLDWQPLDGVTLQDAIWVTLTYGADVAGYDEEPSIVKSGTTQADFLITFTNNDGDVATPALDIYIHFR